MQPDARTIDVTSTLVGEKIAMGLDANSLSQIMDVLTDLYSDPVLAVIREYSTNAFDAHVDAGVSLPIEVTTPSPLSPYFKVRDYGEGLDAEDIRNIYSKYGASTKRDSNDVVGMLGLGCKSALTYTDQFTLQGIKNGVCTQVSVSRDENGAGSMTVVAEYATDEASGVEVSVPVKGTDTEFEETAADFFRFWDEGTVLVNGKEPVRIDGLWISDDLCMTREVTESYVVMGNVAYPMPNDYQTTKIVAFVPIGAVSFTPSREKLHMNPKTTDAVAAIRKRVEDEKKTAVQRLIDAEPNRQAALGVALKAEGLFNVKLGDLSWKGTAIPDRFEIKKDGKAYSMLRVDAVKRYRRKGWERVGFLPTSIVHKTVFVEGYTGGDFSPYKREKLNLWRAEQAEDHDPEFYVLVDKVPNKQWLVPGQVVQWAEINAMKVVREKTQRQDGVPSGSYTGWVGGTPSDTIQAASINPSNRVGLFYCDHKRSAHYRSIIKEGYPNATIVEVTSNRLAKFKRSFPKARPANEMAAKIAKKWIAKLSDEQILSITMQKRNGYYEMYLTQLDPTTIDDPKLSAMLTAVQNRKNVGKLNETYEKMVKFAQRLELPNPLDVLDDYKWLTTSSFYGKLEDNMLEEITLYLNAVYSARKDS